MEGRINVTKWHLLRSGDASLALNGYLAKETIKAALQSPDLGEVVTTKIATLSRLRRQIISKETSKGILALLGVAAGFLLFFILPIEWSSFFLLAFVVIAAFIYRSRSKTDDTWNKLSSETLEQLTELAKSDKSFFDSGVHRGLFLLVGDGLDLKLRIARYHAIQDFVLGKKYRKLIEQAEQFTPKWGVPYYQQAFEHFVERLKYFRANSTYFYERIAFKNPGIESALHDALIDDWDEYRRCIGSLTQELAGTDQAYRADDARTHYEGLRRELQALGFSPP